MESSLSFNNWNLIAAFISGVIGPMLIMWLKTRTINKKVIDYNKQREIDFVVKNQDIINTALNNLQEKYSVDRVWICQFHNGGNFWPGNQSMKKLSVIFESTAANISTDFMKMQNIPVSFFSGLIQQMILTSEPIHLCTNDIKDNALKHYWESRGVALVYLYPIRCLDDMLVGIMGVEQVNEHDTLTSEVSREMFNESIRLSGYIASVVVKKD